MRSWIRTFRLSIKSLLMHPLRSSLTVLGIFIGVSSVIWLLAIGEGISRAAQEQIASLGAKNIIVRTIKPSGDDYEDGLYGITRADYLRLVSTIPSIKVALPIRELAREFRNRTRNFEGRFVGCTPQYAAVTRLSIAKGRFLTDADIDQERNYCVLASESAERLFPVDSPLEKSILIDDEFYTVVGVTKPRAPTAGVGGSLAAEDYSRDVYVPITTMWRRNGDIEITAKPGQFQRDMVELSQITLQIDKQEQVLPTAEVVRDTVSRGHDMSDFGITVPMELLQQAKTTRMMFILFLGLIAAISLVVGGIGIMNIMLATVTERTREIGIRRALGAKRHDIVRQFLVESVVLSIVGGGLGVLGGLFCRPLSIAVRHELYRLKPDMMQDLPELIRTVEPILVSWSVPLAFAISLSVGVLFGVYPAIRAAQLDPIEALRRE